MSNAVSVDAKKALQWLMDGNKEYITSRTNHKGDISEEKRLHTHHHGQNPFALVITCSDSRVIPESIFMQGIGDIFVIRIAGNVLDNFGLGSVEYGIEHLGIKLVMILGHTNCGAIAASLEGSHSSYIGTITNEIKKNIGVTKNPLLACKENVLAEKKMLEDDILTNSSMKEVVIVPAIYHTASGLVTILDETKK